VSKSIAAQGKNLLYSQTQGYAAKTGTAQGLLTSILELGAWVGTLANGYLADALGRRLCAVLACVVFIIGVIVQATTQNKDYVFAGRFVVGLGVGSLSMVVPLYNAELAAPEVRGSLVALQQLAITFGIMVAFWVCRTLNPSRQGFVLNYASNRSVTARTSSVDLVTTNPTPPGWSPCVSKSCPLWYWPWGCSSSCHNRRDTSSTPAVMMSALRRSQSCDANPPTI
jgi:MFS family permease